MTGEVPDVRVPQGELRGTIDHGVPAYLGIPYAAAPFGDLRMQPPAAAAGWAGVRDASQYGPTVPKGDYPPQYEALLPEITIPGDDCLNLNIWTPDPTASGLPVFVWIHGGSFMNGSGSLDSYRGSAFARDGVVCVTINYRLQAEGFLFTEGDINNVGLLDQIAALEWVRDNIAAFGGDPARVTVGGESAGAMSVTTLLSMPRAAGLFRSAITQSGAAAHTNPPQTGTKVTALLAEMLGVEPTRAAIAALPPEQVYAAASALTTEVQTVPDPAKWGELALSLLPFMPTVDGDVLPRPPLESFRAGRGSDVPLLTGSNAEEARLFLVAPGMIELIDEPTATIGASAYGVDGPAAMQTYATPGASAGDTMAAIVTDWFFAVPAIRVAEARGDDSRTWMYRFDQGSTAGGGLMGAAHAVEIPFVFDTLDSPDAPLLLGPDAPQAVADTVHAVWVRFITDTDPGWAPYETSRRTTMIFEAGGTTQVVDNPTLERFKIWEGIR